MQEQPNEPEEIQFVEPDIERMKRELPQYLKTIEDLEEAKKVSWATLQFHFNV